MLFFVLCVFKAFTHSLILFRVKVRVRFKVRFKVKVRVKVKLGLGSAKVECTMYSESGLVPSPSLFQNHVLMGVTSLDVDLRNKGNNKITELRTILQRESQNS